MNRKAIAGLVLGAAVISTAGFAASVAQAHGNQPTMTDEQREHMMEFHGGGYGMGPGAMGPGMMGPGMMGPGMMGPRMMGPGMMGPGMMGPGMMGPGMMGMDPMEALNFTAEQRRRIHEIQDEQRRQNWDSMGKIMDERSKLRDLYDADQWDPKAIGAVYGKIFDLKRQMIETSVIAHNRLEAVLTQEQMDQLAQLRRSMAMAGGPGRGGHGPMHGGMMSQ